MLKKLLIFSLLFLLILGICSAALYIFFIFPPRQLLVPEKYLTIQDAINKARPKDTIIIGSGTYNEIVVSERPIQIQGQDPQRTIIKGGLNILVKEHQRYGKNNTVIKNLSLAAAKSEPGVSACNEVLIENCVIQGGTARGINLSNNKKTIVKNCQVSDCNEDGILTSEIDDLLIIGCTFKNNGGEGIVVKKSRRCTIEKNIASGNETHGILAADSGRVSVRENECYQNNNTGIFLIKCNDSVILENKTSQNKFHGICLQETEGIVQDNHCENNQQDGIYLYCGRKLI
jgi:parallel beta-helix repeat protein